MSDNPHRLNEARSLAYHRAIAQRLRTDPALLDQARERVAGWLAERDPSPLYVTAWNKVLRGSLDEVIALLLDQGEQARELRQSTPFAGMLDPRERWRIWRSVRKGDKP